jgi:hypothetical protein
MRTKYLILLVPQTGFEPVTPSLRMTEGAMSHDRLLVQTHAFAVTQNDTPNRHEEITPDGQTFHHYEFV